MKSLSRDGLQYGTTQLFVEISTESSKKDIHGYLIIISLPYRIMEFSSIGDNTVVHTAASLPTGMSAKVYIGHNVTIGSNCTLYSCHIEDDVFIGDRCVILEGARLEKGCMLAPGSVVPPGRLIPAK